MKSKSSSMPAVRYTGESPPATLRNWCDAHADRVQEVEVGHGYNTDSGKAYDILLRYGWRMSDDYVHTIIEPTVKQTLAQLRCVVPCDCDECTAELAMLAAHDDHSRKEK